SGTQGSTRWKLREKVPAAFAAGKGFEKDRIYRHPTLEFGCRMYLFFLGKRIASYKYGRISYEVPLSNSTFFSCTCGAAACSGIPARGVYPTGHPNSGTVRWSHNRCPLGQGPDLRCPRGKERIQSGRRSRYSERRSL